MTDMPLFGSKAAQTKIPEKKMVKRRNSNTIYILNT